MWRRNYHPLPEDKPKEYLNDAERWDPSTILSYIFLVLLLTLFVHRHRSVHGSRQRRRLHHLLGLPLPGPSSFPLTLQPQAPTSILTFCKFRDVLGL